MKYTLILLCFGMMFCQNKPIPSKMTVRYLPFSTKTSIPITKQGLENQKVSNLNFMKEISISSNTTLTNAQNIFNEISKTQIQKLTDYDLRVVITCFYTNSREEKFYINWDKKYLLYKDNFYSVSDSQMKMLLKTLNIPAY